MATKPTSEPRWADVGGDIVEPSSGKKDVGWVANERPPAQFFNWLLNTIYLWVAWLNSAIVDFGTATVQADVFTVDTAINVSPDQPLHGEVVRTIPCILADYSSAVYANNGRDGAGNNPSQIFFNNTNSAAAFGAVIPLNIVTGDRLKSVTVDIASNADGNDVAAILTKYSGGTVSQLANANTTGTGTLTLTGVASAPGADEWVYEDVAAGDWWGLRLSYTDNDGVTSLIADTVVVTYDRVEP